MSNLFSPIKIKEITFKNRIAISPMCQYSAENGIANDWHLVHYGSRATGGAALIIMEAAAVSPEGRITPGDLGLYHDDQIEKLKNITSFIHQNGSVAGIQLAHAGRKASNSKPWEGSTQLKLNENGWQTIAPSPIPFNITDNIPQMLDTDGIKQIIENFKSAANRAYTAGFKVIEIHAAHGYLIHQFLSPLSNKRMDEYGGSFQNRVRLLIEIVNAIHEGWPKNLPLFVRISATDWAENGWNVEEAIQLSIILKELGVDLIDCSSGGLIPNVTIPVEPGFQVIFSELIKKQANILTGAVGLITQAKQAEKILNNQQADFILIGRESLRDPNFAINAAQNLDSEINWPLQYLRAK